MFNEISTAKGDKTNVREVNEKCRVYADLKKRIMQLNHELGNARMGGKLSEQFKAELRESDSKH